VAREIVEASKKGHPNYASQAVLALGGFALGDALLKDGFTAEARRELLAVKDGAPGAPALAGQVRFLLGRALELEGDREGALVHYKAAAASPDKEGRKRAQAALDMPIPPGEVQGRHAIAEARRHREAGHARLALERYREAYAAWPTSVEATLALAEEELRAGRVPVALQLAPDLGDDKPQDPGWLRAWGWLLRARAHDLEGSRPAAVSLYKKVLEQPHGRPELKDAAALGLKTPFRPAAPSAPATPAVRSRH
jgi:tetratricopeptide (TPR) repeat protein